MGLKGKFSFGVSGLLGQGFQGPSATLGSGFSSGGSRSHRVDWVWKFRIDDTGT